MEETVPGLVRRAATKFGNATACSMDGSGSQLWNRLAQQGMTDLAAEATPVEVCIGRRLRPARPRHDR